MSHSDFTVKSYKTAINKLRLFLAKKYSCNEIQICDKVFTKEIDIYHLLREFVVYLDQLGHKPLSIQAYLSGAKGYFRYIGVKISTDDFRQLVKIPKAVTNHEEALTKEILVRLLHNCPSKLQTGILVAVSSGMRLGEIVQLRLGDINFSSTPTTIRIRGETSKTRKGREVFISAEATKALKDYLVRYFSWNENGDNSHMQTKPIFGRTSSGNTYANKLISGSRWAAELALQQSLSSHIKKIPALNRKNENGRSLIHWHSFRKFFRTTVGNVTNRDFAEDLIGHEFYMSTYYNLSADKKLELYLKAEPALTISDSIIIEKSYAKLSGKYDNLSGKFDNLMHYLTNNGVRVPESLAS